MFALVYYPMCVGESSLYFVFNLSLLVVSRLTSFQHDGLVLHLPHTLPNLWPLILLGLFCQRRVLCCCDGFSDLLWSPSFTVCTLPIRLLLITSRLVFTVDIFLFLLFFFFGVFSHLPLCLSSHVAFGDH